MRLYHHDDNYKHNKYKFGCGCRPGYFTEQPKYYVRMQQCFMSLSRVLPTPEQTIATGQYPILGHPLQLHVLRMCFISHELPFNPSQVSIGQWACNFPDLLVIATCKLIWSLCGSPVPYCLALKFLLIMHMVIIISTAYIWQYDIDRSIVIWHISSDRSPKLQMLSVLFKILDWLLQII